MLGLPARLAALLIVGQGMNKNRSAFGRGIAVRKPPVALACKLNRTLQLSRVARGTQALERVGKKLIKPGIRLPEKKGVPRYSADENSPGVIIRRLNGKVSTGRLENGEFVETE